MPKLDIEGNSYNEPDRYKKCKIAALVWGPLNSNQ